MLASGPYTRGPQWPPVRGRQDLDVAAVGFVPARPPAPASGKCPRSVPLGPGVDTRSVRTAACCTNPWVLRFRIPGVMTSSATVPPWPGRPIPIKPTPGPPFPRTKVAPPELAPNTPGHIRTDSRAHRGRDRCARVDQELLPAAGDQRRFPRSRFISQAQVGPAFEQHP